MDAFNDLAHAATPASTRAADALELARLAALSPLDYDRERNAEAERLGVRVSVLDEEVRKARGYPENVTPDDAEARPPEFTDEALALRFATTHENRLRYVAAWGRWFIWDGTTWRADETMQAFDFARAICRQASAECNDPDDAANIAAARTVAAVERLAKADRRLAATVDQWDADPWLLNTPDGVLDLRTGQQRPHRPDDYLTKITAVPASGDCPLWRAFLARVTNGNVELQLFLQRMAGYALTGSTKAHALFFVYGLGGNGKGVALNTITRILNSYAAVASMETFTSSPSDRHPTDLAMLRGARLVTAQETEEGRRWAESRIKAMTGGDPITARFMRQDFFTFTPQFKLIIAGNHRPGLRNVDEAIRRRFHLIPFDVKISAAERDPDLPDKLEKEWPGILQWAVDGCMLWQERGLAAPETVINATEEYLEAEDATGQWLDECCIQARHLYATSGALFASWKAWAERTGEFVGSQKRFVQSLQSRGLLAKREGGTGRSGFEGIGLKPDREPPEWA
ncbi:phage/plasmid primase, P4 family [Limobrevibacterium gyesilva]|uniref:Phage/plasmid primase, P4 family n=1 Tax=Limobrevibacterium gyesilva TaxID=2991712 RepID=A0AA41YPT1_9PROT|nr:phage/plasmid primase, P4 family [Limobrevibacterium gyesilva]MCW3476332.1 phage/plasmid primase, P4 family [Limobrevibacterium gyesilva]